jgi:tyrosine-protein kinase Etk/Wzc
MEDKYTGSNVSDKFESENSIFNVKWIITTLFAIWPWFLGSIFIALVTCNIYLRYTVPVYRISGEIIIGDNSGSTKNSPNQEAFVLEGLGITSSKSDVNNVMRIIKSTTTMMKVVQRLELHVQYFEPGKVKMTEFYSNSPFKFVMSENSLDPGTYKIKFDAKDNFNLTLGQQSWRGRLDEPAIIQKKKIVVKKIFSTLKENTEYVVRISDVKGVAAMYAGGLSITKTDKLANSLEIAMLSEIPQKAKDIIDTLIKVYEINNIENRNRIADNTIAFINERLKDVGSELRHREDDIKTFKESNNLVDIQSSSLALIAKTEQYKDQLIELEIQSRMLESALKYLATNATGPLPAIITSDPTISQYSNMYNVLQAEREQLKATTTKNNPQRVSIEAQLDELRSKMVFSIKTLQNSLKIKIDQYSRQNELITGRIKQVPTKEKAYLEFEREQNIIEQLYLYLLRKREETAVAKSSTISNVTVVDPAENKGQIKPDKGKLRMTAFMLGFLAPIIGLAIRRTLNTKIIAKTDIVKQTDIPIIGEIGHSSNEIAVAVRKNSNTLLAEQFRALRTNLQFILPEKNGKTILLTSSMSGEGKSFIAINLASTFAISGKKVALVEMDMRRPKISKNLGLDNGVGLSNYAIGQVDLHQIIQKSGFEDNLYVVPSGPIPPNPAELIMLPKIQAMFDTLKSEFDYVVIDTAPIGLVTDAQLLSPNIDTTLYVIRQGYTFKQQMQIVNDMQNGGKMPRLGLIINDVVFTRGYSYGYGYGYESGYGGKYGYSYRYGYKYGYGYGSYGNGYYHENEKKNGVKSSLMDKLKLKKKKV